MIICWYIDICRQYGIRSYIHTRAQWSKKGPLIHFWQTHLKMTYTKGGRDVCQKCTSFLGGFVKRGEGVKNLEKVMTSFMNGPFLDQCARVYQHIIINHFNLWQNYFKVPTHSVSPSPSYSKHFLGWKSSYAFKLCQCTFHLNKQQWDYTSDYYGQRKTMSHNIISAWMIDISKLTKKKLCTLEYSSRTPFPLPHFLTSH